MVKNIYNQALRYISSITDKLFCPTVLKEPRNSRDIVT
jgi:hypothetical protein